MTMTQQQKWFTELKKIEWPDRPWIILGKGPSFDKFYKFTSNSFNICALNHVGLKLTTQLSIFIDLDVYSEKLQTNANYVLGPQHPHVNFKPSTHTLFELVRPHKRLFQYKLSTWRRHRAELAPAFHTKHYNRLPIIDAKYNVAEAAFQILAYLGIKEICSLGIDGGTTYSKKFGKYKPLKNGQPNFDKQFQEIEKTCQKFSIKWERL